MQEGASTYILLASFPGHLKIRPGIHCLRQYSVNLRKIIQFTSLDVPGFMGITHMCEQCIPGHLGNEVNILHGVVCNFP